LVKTIMPALVPHIASVHYSSALTKVNRITKLGRVVYLIGGPPRCGKSVLARRLATDHAILFVPTDLMWAVVEVSEPDWRTPMQKGPDRIPTAAKMFEPYVERAIAFLQPARQPFGIEGEVITPETAARLSSKYDLRVAFLVRSSATAADIADSRGPTPWLEAAPPDLVASVTAEVLSWSNHVQSACRRLSIPCFDVGGDFEHAIGDAACALMPDPGLDVVPG
jgi:hypothetical protein